MGKSSASRQAEVTECPSVERVKEPGLALLPRINDFKQVVTWAVVSPEGDSFLRSNRDA